MATRLFPLVMFSNCYFPLLIVLGLPFAVSPLNAQQVGPLPQELDPTLDPKGSGGAGSGGSGVRAGSGASGQTFYMQALELKADASTLLTNSLEVLIP